MLKIKALNPILNVVLIAAVAKAMGGVVTFFGMTFPAVVLVLGVLGLLTFLFNGKGFFKTGLLAVLATTLIMGLQGAAISFFGFTLSPLGLFALGLAFGAIVLYSLLGRPQLGNVKIGSVLAVLIVGILLTGIQILGVSKLDFLNVLMFFPILIFGTALITGMFVMNHKRGATILGGAGDLVAKWVGFIAGFVTLKGLSYLIFSKAFGVAMAGDLWITSGAISLGLILFFGIMIGVKGGKYISDAKHPYLRRFISEAARVYWMTMSLLGWFVIAPMPPVLSLTVGTHQMAVSYDELFNVLQGVAIAILGVIATGKIVAIFERAVIKKVYEMVVGNYLQGAMSYAVEALTTKISIVLTHQSYGYAKEALAKIAGRPYWRLVLDFLLRRGPGNPSTPSDPTPYRDGPTGMGREPIVQSAEIVDSAAEARRAADVLRRAEDAVSQAQEDLRRAERELQRAEEVEQGATQTVRSLAQEVARLRRDIGPAEKVASGAAQQALELNDQAQAAEQQNGRAQEAAAALAQARVMASAMDWELQSAQERMQSSSRQVQEQRAAIEYLRQVLTAAQQTAEAARRSSNAERSTGGSDVKLRLSFVPLAIWGGLVLLLALPGVIKVAVLATLVVGAGFITIRLLLKRLLLRNHVAARAPNAQEENIEVHPAPFFFINPRPQPQGDSLQAVHVGGIGAVYVSSSWDSLGWFARPLIDIFRDLIINSEYLSRPQPESLDIVIDVLPDGKIATVSRHGDRIRLNISIQALAILSKLHGSDYQTFRLFLVGLIDGHEVSHIVDLLSTGTTDEERVQEEHLEFLHRNIGVLQAVVAVLDNPAIYGVRADAKFGRDVQIVLSFHRSDVAKEGMLIGSSVWLDKQMQELLGPHRHKFSGIVSQYENLIISGRIKEAEVLGQEIDGHVNELNRYRPHGEVEMVEPPLLDEQGFTDADIALAESVQLQGQYVPLFFFAGSMTRMRRSLRGLGTSVAESMSLYMLDPVMAMQEFLYRHPDHSLAPAISAYVASSGRFTYTMGQRQLVMYRGYLESLARARGQKPEAVISRQKLIIAVNDNNADEILGDIYSHNFFGFNPKNVWFVSQWVFGGYRLLGNGNFSLDTNSPRHPIGNTDPLYLLTRPHMAFRLQSSGRRQYERTYFEGSLQQYLMSQGVDMVGTHRVNDLTRFLIDEIAPARKLAYAMKMMRSGYNTIVEMVANYSGQPQKGAYLFSDEGHIHLIEGRKIAGNPELLKKVDAGVAEGRGSYSTFRNFYKLNQISSIVHAGQGWDLRFEDGRFYVEGTAGDMTQNSASYTAAFRTVGRIRDFKAVSAVQLADAARVLPVSDTQLQEVLWYEGRTAAVAQRAEGFEIVRYFWGGALARVMLIRKDGHLLVRKEEKGNPQTQDIKLVREIEFLRSLSGQEGQHFVRVLDFSIAQGEGITWYEYPYYDEAEWMTLEQLIVIGKISAQQALEIIEHIFETLIADGFYRPMGDVVPDRYIESFLLGKVRNNLAHAAELSPVFVDLAQGPVVVNGQPFPHLLDLLDVVVEAFGNRLAPKRLYRIHGDLSAENILMNYRQLEGGQASADFVLIDPRGGRIGYDIYYELAKLGEGIFALHGYALLEKEGYFVSHTRRNGDGQETQNHLSFFVRPQAAVRQYQELSRLFLEFLTREDQPLARITGEAGVDLVRYFALTANVVASTIPYNIRPHEAPKHPLFMYAMATRLLSAVLAERSGIHLTLADVLGVSMGMDLRIAAMVESLRVSQDERLLVGFDVTGTLREYSEKQVREEIVYQMVEVAYLLGNRGRIFVMTGRDLKETKAVLLDTYRDIARTRDLFAPDYYIYVAVLDSAKIYQYYPIQGRFKSVSTSLGFLQRDKERIQKALIRLIRELDLPVGKDSIVVQGRRPVSRIEFDLAGKSATEDERQEFVRRDILQNIRTTFLLFFTTLISDPDIEIRLHGRTSVVIMPKGVNREEGIRKLKRKLSDSARVIYFDNFLGSAASVDLLGYVGSEAVAPSDQVMVSNREMGARNTQATAKYLYQLNIALTRMKEEQERGREGTSGSNSSHDVRTSVHVAPLLVFVVGVVVWAALPLVAKAIVLGALFVGFGFWMARLLKNLLLRHSVAARAPNLKATRSFLQRFIAATLILPLIVSFLGCADDVNRSRDAGAADSSVEDVLTPDARVDDAGILADAGVNDATVPPVDVAFVETDAADAIAGDAGVDGGMVRPQTELILGGAAQYTGSRASAQDITAFHQNFLPVVEPIGQVAAVLAGNDHSTIKTYLPPNHLTAADEAVVGQFTRDLYRNHGIRTLPLFFAMYGTNAQGEFLLANPTPENLQILRNQVRAFARWVRAQGDAIAAVQLGNENEYYVAGASRIFFSGGNPWDTINLTPGEYHDLMNDLAAEYKAEDGDRLVFLGHGELFEEQIELIAPHMNNFDGIALNTYPDGIVNAQVLSVETLRGYYREQMEFSHNLGVDRVLIGEFGYSSTGPLGDEGQVQFAQNVTEALRVFAPGANAGEREILAGLLWHEYFAEYWKDAVIDPASSGLALFDDEQNFAAKPAFRALSEGYRRIIEMNIGLVLILILLIGFSTSSFLAFSEGEDKLSTSASRKSLVRRLRGLWATLTFGLVVLLVYVVGRNDQNKALPTNPRREEGAVDAADAKAFSPVEGKGQQQPARDVVANGAVQAGQNSNPFSDMAVPTVVVPPAFPQVPFVNLPVIGSSLESPSLDTKEDARRMTMAAAINEWYRNLIDSITEVEISPEGAVITIHVSALEQESAFEGAVEEEQAQEEDDVAFPAPFTPTQAARRVYADRQGPENAYKGKVAIDGESVVVVQEENGSLNDLQREVVRDLVMASEELKRGPPVNKDNEPVAVFLTSDFSLTENSLAAANPRELNIHLFGVDRLVALKQAKRHLEYQNLLKFLANIVIDKHEFYHVRGMKEEQARIYTAYYLKNNVDAWLTMLFVLDQRHSRRPYHEIFEVEMDEQFRTMLMPLESLGEYVQSQWTFYKDGDREAIQRIKRVIQSFLKNYDAQLQAGMTDIDLKNIGFDYGVFAHGQVALIDGLSLQVFNGTRDDRRAQLQAAVKSLRGVVSNIYSIGIDRWAVLELLYELELIDVNKIMGDEVQVASRKTPARVNGTKVSTGIADHDMQIFDPTRNFEQVNEGGILILTGLAGIFATHIYVGPWVALAVIVVAGMIVWKKLGRNHRGSKRNTASNSGITRRDLPAVLSALWAAACGRTEPLHEGDTIDGQVPDEGMVSDAGAAQDMMGASDAARDLGVDATVEAGVDAARDAFADAGRDAAIDATPDMGRDMETDLGADATSDLGVDAARDADAGASPDAQPDAQADAGRTPVPENIYLGGHGNYYFGLPRVVDGRPIHDSREYMRTLEFVDQVAPILAANGHNRIWIGMPPNHFVHFDPQPLEDLIRRFANMGLKVVLTHYAGWGASNEFYPPVPNGIDPVQYHLDLVRQLIREFAQWASRLGESVAAVEFFGFQTPESIQDNTAFDHLGEDRDVWHIIRQHFFNEEGVVEIGRFYGFLNELAGIYRQEDPVHSIFLADYSLRGVNADIREQLSRNFNNFNGMKVVTGLQRGEPTPEGEFWGYDELLETVEEIAERYREEIEILNEMGIQNVIIGQPTMLARVTCRDGQCMRFPWVENVLEAIARFMPGAGFGYPEIVRGVDWIQYLQRFDENRMPTEDFFALSRGYQQIAAQVAAAQGENHPSPMAPIKEARRALKSKEFSAFVTVTARKDVLVNRGLFGRALRYREVEAIEELLAVPSYLNRAPPTIWITNDVSQLQGKLFTVSPDQKFFYIDSFFINKYIELKTQGLLVEAENLRLFFKGQVDGHEMLHVEDILKTGATEEVSVWQRNIEYYHRNLDVLSATINVLNQPEIFGIVADAAFAQMIPALREIRLFNGHDDVIVRRIDQIREVEIILIQENSRQAAVFISDRRHALDEAVGSFASFVEAQGIEATIVPTTQDIVTVLVEKEGQKISDQDYRTWSQHHRRRLAPWLASLGGKIIKVGQHVAFILATLVVLTRSSFGQGYNEASHPQGIDIFTELFYILLVLGAPIALIFVLVRIFSKKERIDSPSSSNLPPPSSSSAPSSPASPRPAPRVSTPVRSRQPEEITPQQDILQGLETGTPSVNDLFHQDPEVRDAWKVVETYFTRHTQISQRFRLQAFLADLKNRLTKNGLLELVRRIRNGGSQPPSPQGGGQGPAGGNGSGRPNLRRGPSFTARRMMQIVAAIFTGLFSNWAMASEPFDLIASHSVEKDLIEMTQAGTFHGMVLSAMLATLMVILHRYVKHGKDPRLILRRTLVTTILLIASLGAVIDQITKHLSVTTFFHHFESISVTRKAVAQQLLPRISDEFVTIFAALIPFWILFSIFRWYRKEGGRFALSVSIGYGLVLSATPQIFTNIFPVVDFIPIRKGGELYAYANVADVIALSGFVYLLGLSVFYRISKRFSRRVAVAVQGPIKQGVSDGEMVSGMVRYMSESAEFRRQEALRQRTVLQGSQDEADDAHGSDKPGPLSAPYRLAPSVVAEYEGKPIYQGKVVIRGLEISVEHQLGRRLTEEEIRAIRQLILASFYLRRGPPVDEVREIILTSNSSLTQKALAAFDENTQILYIHLFNVDQMVERIHREDFEAARDFELFFQGMIDGHEAFHAQGSDEEKAQDQTILYFIQHPQILEATRRTLGTLIGLIVIERAFNRLMQSRLDPKAIEESLLPEAIPQEGAVLRLAKRLRMEEYDFFHLSRAETKIRSLQSGLTWIWLLGRGSYDADEVLAELLKNAFDAYARARETGAILLRVYETPQEWMIEILDNGIGVDWANTRRLENGIWIVLANSSASRGYPRLGAQKVGVRDASQTIVANGGQMEYLPSSQKGYRTMVRIRLPKETVTMFLFARRQNRVTLQAPDVVGQLAITEDGGYNDYPIEKTLAEIATAGHGRKPRRNEGKQLTPARNEAMRVLGQDHLNVVKGLPTLRMIDSKNITFGAYYDPLTHTVYIQTLILANPAYNLVLVFIHELNGRTHLENAAREAQHVMESYVTQKVRRVYTSDGVRRILMDLNGNGGNRVSLILISTDQEALTAMAVGHAQALRERNAVFQITEKSGAIIVDAQYEDPRIQGPLDQYGSLLVSTDGEGIPLRILVVDDHLAEPIKDILEIRSEIGPYELILFNASVGTDREIVDSLIKFLQMNEQLGLPIDVVILDAHWPTDTQFGAGTFLDAIKSPDSGINTPVIIYSSEADASREAFYGYAIPDYIMWRRTHRLVCCRLTGRPDDFMVTKSDADGNRVKIVRKGLLTYLKEIRADVEQRREAARVGQNAEPLPAPFAPTLAARRRYRADDFKAEVVLAGSGSAAVTLNDAVFSDSMKAKIGTAAEQEAWLALRVKASQELANVSSYLYALLEPEGKRVVVTSDFKNTGNKIMAVSSDRQTLYLHLFVLDKLVEFSGGQDPQNYFHYESLRATWLFFLRIILREHERFHFEGDDDDQALRKTIHHLRNNSKDFDLMIYVSDEPGYEIVMDQDLQRILLTERPSEVKEDDVDLHWLEKVILQHNGLISLSSRVALLGTGKGFNVVRAEKGQGRYLRIGSLIFVTKDLVLPIPPETVPYLLRQIFVVPTRGSLSQELIPVIAGMLEHPLKDQMVEIDGEGSGLLAHVALRLGARQVVIVDENFSVLKET
ncbi:MAG: hypothetical protein NUV91_07765 [Candidatus Omnitrophica bacterium]|nr:hypothetical protein [Candidatus Omnitrophota bacterium]